jgi:hypothetical protein
VVRGSKECYGDTIRNSGSRPSPSTLTFLEKRSCKGTARALEVSENTIASRICREKDAVKTDVIAGRQPQESSGTVQESDWLTRQFNQEGQAY